MSTTETYSPEQIDRALRVLAEHDGNAVAAHKRLADQGLKIPKSVLRQWRKVDHAGRYQQLRDEVRANDDKPAAEARRKWSRMSLAELKAVDMDEIPVAEIPALMLRLASAPHGVDLPTLVDPAAEYARYDSLSTSIEHPAAPVEDESTSAILARLRELGAAA